MTILHTCMDSEGSDEFKKVSRGVVGRQVDILLKSCSTNQNNISKHLLASNK